MDARALIRLLECRWGLSEPTVAPLTGGMNSRTWLVRTERASYVAKQVALRDVQLLDGGCTVAERLARSGLATGRPVSTLDGVHVALEARLALLEHVPGRELDGGTAEEQRWIARTLARAHSAGAPVSHSTGSRGFLKQVEPTAAGVDRHSWLPPAIRSARAATDGLTVTWSILHTDPAPEAFRHDEATGVTGLIDWTGAQPGPVLYDVASAVMYLGGPQQAAPFLDEYVSASPTLSGELRHLDAFRRLRWAVQAAYFARRLATQDLTGIIHQSENQRGLDDARRGLAELSLP